MPSKAKSRGLGKGLAALLGPEPQTSETGFVPNLDIDKIQPNPKQPRSRISPEDLIGLADSIREYGIIEPLIVTKAETGEFQLVAGERRWRAAKLAQIKQLPVIIKEASPQQILEMAIIENIQRKDLNSIEEATALAELYNNYRVKLEDISKKVGKEVSTISNKMRLLKLPLKVQQGILDGEVTESHAYILMTLKSKDALLAAYTVVAKKHLSVRQTEEIVRKIALANSAVIPPKPKQNGIVYDKITDEIHTNLTEKLGKGFRLVRRKNGGRIVIPFQSDDQLQALYKFLLKDLPAPKDTHSGPKDGENPAKGV